MVFFSCTGVVALVTCIICSFFFCHCNLSSRCHHPALASLISSSLQPLHSTLYHTYTLPRCRLHYGPVNRVLCLSRGVSMGNAPRAHDDDQRAELPLLGGRRVIGWRRPTRRWVVTLGDYLRKFPRSKGGMNGWSVHNEEEVGMAMMHSN